MRLNKAFGGNFFLAIGKIKGAHKVGSNKVLNVYYIIET